MRKLRLREIGSITEKDTEWKLPQLHDYFISKLILFLHHPDAKSWLIWKDLDDGKDWGWEEKGTTEDEMAGWHHRLNAHEFGWTLRVGDGQGGLVCCDSWGHKESDTTERLNWTELILLFLKQIHTLSSLGPVLVFWDCYNKMPQNE